MTIPNVVLTKRYAAAVAYASIIHAGDVRKGTESPTFVTSSVSQVWLSRQVVTKTRR